MTLWLLLLGAPIVERVELACRAIDPSLRPTIEQASTTDEFVARTGRARFEAAATIGTTIWLQPSKVLDRLPELDSVLKHECVHAMLRARGVPPLDVVLEEAVALELSGQASRLAPADPVQAEEHASIAAQLTRPRDRVALERAAARAAATYGARVRAWHKAGVLIAELKTFSRSGSGR